jgi:YbgC/YbaW family acyl-CoA thioester hydrolase
MSASTPSGESRVYRCTLEVRGYELDSFGHVNNAVYLNYLEHARWKMLNQEGVTLEKITRDQRWPVIAAIEIKYIRPLFMGETVEIRSRVIEHSKATFLLEQLLYRGETAIAAAKVTCVIVNEAGRPAELPESYEKFWS